MKTNLTMADVKRINREKGFFFFDADTMRFWGTTYISWLLPNLTFVTGDDNFDRSRTLYSIRRFDPESGKISTLEFQKYDNAGDALEAAKSYE